MQSSPSRPNDSAFSALAGKPITDAAAPPPVRRVVIIGAGLSGLTTAYEIQEKAKAAGAPLELTVFESRSRIGGAIWTEKIDGFMCEGGADSFITNKPWALELCKQLGLGDTIIGTDDKHRRSFVLRRGQLHPVPDGFVLMAPNRAWPILTSPILSWKGKLRLMLEPFVPRGDANADESLASFVRRRLGSEALERLVQPLVGGIYTADPKELSLRSTMPQFIEMEQRHGSLLRASLFRRKSGQDIEKHSSGARYGLFASLRDGMGKLPEALAAALPPRSIRLSTSVRRVVHDRSGKARWAIELLNGEQVLADAVVLATEAHAAARLMDEQDSDLSTLLRSIPYASSAIALVGYHRSDIRHPLDGFGVVNPAIEHRKTLAISFTSVKLPSRAPQGKVLMRVFVGGATQPELFDLPDDAIERIVQDEVRELLGAEGPPILYRLARHARAMPQYTLGHADRVRRIKERLETHQGLSLASNAIGGVGVPDVVRTAQLAADAAFQSIEPTRIR
jgi:oxygen-dependent protoporphyrinogen oxidase